MMHKKNRPASIMLAHINDTHSYFEPTSLQLSLNIKQQTLTPYVSAGGFARIATRVAQLKDDAARMKRQFLFLHAGDCFQGTLYFSLFKGKANADMLNALHIDAMALGNHELDMGNEPVAHFVERIQFPLLAGNWDLSNERKDKPYPIASSPQVISYDSQGQYAQWIEKQAGEETIAIFGLSLDKMTDIANPDPDTPFANAIETARNTIKQLHRKGINKIILLSHLGYEADIELAQQVDGIGIIVGGHSHRLQGDFSALGLKKDDDYGLRINDTYVVQAGYYALSLGHCQVDFSTEGKVVGFCGGNELLLGRRLFLDASMNQAGTDESHLSACEFLNNHPNVVVCKKDPLVQGILIDKYMPRVRQLQQNIIAHADRSLRHVRIPDEMGASELAPLVAKSFVYAMKERGHPVQFAIHNAGGVRNSLNAGKVSIADIAGNLLPFAVPIGVYHIQGKVIAQVVEGAINNALGNGVNGTGSGSYPYTHNLSFVYHHDWPIGNRVTDVKLFDEKLGWQLIDSEKYYCGSSSAYTMKGKEGYDTLLEMQGEGIVSNVSMADAFIELLTAHPETLNTLESSRRHNSTV
ncbi:bifunctional metallophosphatase/5'-nucleotidase [Vibrio aestuarianus]|uniref:bifunctional metallophosphatase/5'-nucleotidase n=1 Tax=Vibrio aestuarianus TaxID=28171 RepID=UPI00237D0E7B|nr:bifunctional UDP-sugar hydrolase/5'-nucleotidase [Vibrio aestuarianus]MDE1253619.1 bifunctional metallophosphatase/5'-nucleotidase [Vibrio aestuarianus]